MSKSRFNQTDDWRRNNSSITKGNGWGTYPPVMKNLPQEFTNHDHKRTPSEHEDDAVSDTAGLSDLGTLDGFLCLEAADVRKGRLTSDLADVGLIQHLKGEELPVVELVRLLRHSDFDPAAHTIDYEIASMVLSKGTDAALQLVLPRKQAIMVALVLLNINKTGVGVWFRMLSHEFYMSAQCAEHMRARQTKTGASMLKKHAAWAKVDIAKLRNILSNIPSTATYNDVYDMYNKLVASKTIGTMINRKSNSAVGRTEHTIAFAYDMITNPEACKMNMQLLDANGNKVETHVAGGRVRFIKPPGFTFVSAEPKRMASSKAYVYIVANRTSSAWADSTCHGLLKPSKYICYMESVGQGVCGIAWARDQHTKNCLSGQDLLYNWSDNETCTVEEKDYYLEVDESDCPAYPYDTSAMVQMLLFMQKNNIYEKLDTREDDSAKLY